MASIEESQVVLIDDPAHMDVVRVGEVLSGIVGRNFNDVCRDLRLGAGILLLDAGADTASAFVEKLHVLDVSARAVPSELFPELPRVLRVKDVDVGADALVVGTGYGQEPQRIAWETIKWLHFYGLERDALGHEVRRDRHVFDPRETTFSKRCGSIIQALKRYEEKRKDRILDLCVDALCLEPVGFIRFVLGDFGFSYLGARKSPHSVDNFLTFGRDFLRHARAARVTDAMHQFFGMNETRDETDIRTDDERMVMRIEEATFESSTHRDNHLRYQQYAVLREHWNLDGHPPEVVPAGKSGRLEKSSFDVRYHCPACKTEVEADAKGRCPACGTVVVGRLTKGGEFGIEALLYALLGGAAALSIVATLMSGDPFFLGGAGLALAILVFHFVKSKF